MRHRIGSRCWIRPPSPNGTGSACMTARPRVSRDNAKPRGRPWRNMCGCLLRRRCRPWTSGSPSPETGVEPRPVGASSATTPASRRPHRGERGQALHYYTNDHRSRQPRPIAPECRNARPDPRLVRRRSRSSPGCRRTSSPYSVPPSSRGEMVFKNSRSDTLPGASFLRVSPSRTGRADIFSVAG